MPEQPLGQMMPAKRRESRDNGHGRPPVDRVDHHETASPGQSSKRGHGSLGIGHVLCRHAKRDEIESALALKLLDAFSDPLMDEIVLVDCLVRIYANQYPAPPHERLRQTAIAR